MVYQRGQGEEMMGTRGLRPYRAKRRRAAAVPRSSFMWTTGRTFATPVPAAYAPRVPASDRG